MVVVELWGGECDGGCIEVAEPTPELNIPTTLGITGMGMIRGYHVYKRGDVKRFGAGQVPTFEYRFSHSVPFPSGRGQPGRSDVHEVDSTDDRSSPR